MAQERCKDGCTYSRSMDQVYPRLCVKCGLPEEKAIDPPRRGFIARCIGAIVGAFVIGIRPPQTDPSLDSTKYPSDIISISIEPDCVIRAYKGNVFIDFPGHKNVFIERISASPFPFFTSLKYNVNDIVVSRAIHDKVMHWLADNQEYLARYGVWSDGKIV